MNKFHLVKILQLFLLINFSYAEDPISLCGTFIAKDMSSCTEYSTKSQYCCYLTTFSNSLYSKMCYPILIEEYLTLNSEINLGGYKYSVDCGNFIGSTCGTINTPISYKDCSQASLKDNSCCYVKYNNTTSCVRLGTGNIGEVTYNGLKIICGAERFKSVFYLLVMFLSIILF
jgi:hypothetical protein